MVLLVHEAVIAATWVAVVLLLLWLRIARLLLGEAIATAFTLRLRIASTIVPIHLHLHLLLVLGRHLVLLDLLHLLLLTGAAAALLRRIGPGLTPVAVLLHSRSNTV